jgi:cytochrome c oxidase subunit III
VKLSVAFAALASGIVVWWLIVRRLTARPWEAQGSTAGREAAGMLDPAPARTGLWIFLAVLTSLFALTITGYWMRMGHGAAEGVAPVDWHPLTEPRILWFNTALLVLGSVSMQWARHAAERGDAARTQVAWLCGGVFAAAFIVGQGMAWRQLQAAGVYAASNPANAAFYLLTGLHAAHLIGGLVAWVRTSLRMFRADSTVESTRLGVELCTVYWHFLLLVWLVLFGLLLKT